MEHLVSHFGAASLLAIRRTHLREMVRAGTVPHVVMPCGEIRFRPASLEAWTQEREQLPSDEADTGTH